MSGEPRARPPREGSLRGTATGGTPGGAPASPSAATAASASSGAAAGGSGPAKAAGAAHRIELASDGELPMPPRPARSGTIGSTASPESHQQQQQHHHPHHQQHHRPKPRGFPSERGPGSPSGSKGAPGAGGAGVARPPSERSNTNAPPPSAHDRDGIAKPSIVAVAASPPTAGVKPHATKPHGKLNGGPPRARPQFPSERDASNAASVAAAAAAAGTTTAAAAPPAAAPMAAPSSGAPRPSLAEASSASSAVFTSAPLLPSLPSAAAASSAAASSAGQVSATSSPSVSSTLLASSGGAVTATSSPSTASSVSLISSAPSSSACKSDQPPPRPPKVTDAPSDRNYSTLPNRTKAKGLSRDDLSLPSPSKRPAVVTPVAPLQLGSASLRGGALRALPHRRRPRFLLESRRLRRQRSDPASARSRERSNREWRGRTLRRLAATSMSRLWSSTLLPNRV